MAQEYKCMVLWIYYLVSEMLYFVNPNCLQRNTNTCYTLIIRNFGVWYMHRWNVLFGLSWRSCALVHNRRVGLNWWRGLKIYVLTYFQVTEKKNKFFEEPPPQLKHQNFATMNLSRPLLKVIYEHLCMLSLKKDCHFFMSVKYKALNCCNLLVNCVRALLSTLCWKFGLGLKKNFKPLKL